MYGRFCFCQSDMHIHLGVLNIVRLIHLWEISKLINLQLIVLSIFTGTGSFRCRTYFLCARCSAGKQRPWRRKLNTQKQSLPAASRCYDW